MTRRERTANSTQIEWWIPQAIQNFILSFDRRRAEQQRVPRSSSPSFSLFFYISRVAAFFFGSRETTTTHNGRQEFLCWCSCCSPHLLCVHNIIFGSLKFPRRDPWSRQRSKKQEVEWQAERSSESAAKFDFSGLFQVLFFCLETTTFFFRHEISLHNFRANVWPSDEGLNCIWRSWHGGKEDFMKFPMNPLDRSAA